MPEGQAIRPQRNRHAADEGGVVLADQDHGCSLPEIPGRATGQGTCAERPICNWHPGPNHQLNDPLPRERSRVAPSYPAADRLHAGAEAEEGREQAENKPPSKEGGRRERGCRRCRRNRRGLGRQAGAAGYTSTTGRIYVDRIRRAANAIDDGQTQRQHPERIAAGARTRAGKRAQDSEALTGSPYPSSLAKSPFTALAHPASLRSRVAWLIAGLKRRSSRQLSANFAGSG